MNSLYDESPFLEHHGIKGQKWGVRNGPPYPLKLKKRWGFKKIDDSEAKNKRPVTSAVANRTKDDEIMIKEIQAWEDKERKHILRGKQLVHNLDIAKYKLSRITDDVDAKNKLPLLKRNETPEEAVKNTNISKGTHLASGNNCCLCTIAYDLRRRGYDVISKQNAPINLLYDISEEDVSWMYNNAKVHDTKTAKGLQEALNKQPDGARGAAFCSWGEGTGGHVVAYEVKNGKGRLYDSQTGDIYENVSDLFDNVTSTSFIRLDNIEPNYNFAKIAVE